MYAESRIKTKNGLPVVYHHDYVMFTFTYQCGAEWVRHLCLSDLVCYCYQRPTGLTS